MSEWISVNDDRKPPLMQGEDSLSVTVLLYVPRMSKHAVLGQYLYFSRKFRPDGSMGFEKDVTHWMPLPDPPKEQP